MSASNTFDESRRKAIAVFKSPAFRKLIREEDPNMLPYIPKFIQMATLGYLTVESQKGHSESGVSPPPLPPRPYNIEQRSYICGWMETTRAFHFFYLFNQNDGQCVSVVHFIEGEDVDRQSFTELGIPVTGQKVGNRGREEYVTKLHFVIPYEIKRHELSSIVGNKHFLSSIKYDKFVTEAKYKFVICWDAVWKRNTLFKNVIRTLRQCSTR